MKATEQIYQPLDTARQEIRVLLLHPLRTQHDEILECTLETVSLVSDPRPEYEAISYCWAEAAGSGPLMINGVHTSAPNSAIRALRRFRQQHATRALWIDAVCVSQTDVKERSEQVMLMQQIYSSTTQALIWLGESQTFVASHLLRAFKSILHNRETTMSGDRDPVKHYTEILMGQRERPPPVHLDQDSKAAFLTFFSQPWFSRLWVIQEALLAPGAICCSGPFELPWSTLLEIVQWMAFHPFLVADSRGAQVAMYVLQTISIALKGFMHASLLDIFRRASPLQVTDQKDRVYGMLGIVARAKRWKRVPELLVVDYGQTVAGIYAKATRAAILEEGNLDSLRHVHDYDEGHEDEPTSVNFPSWTVRLDRSYGDRGVYADELPLVSPARPEIAKWQLALDPIMKSYDEHSLLLNGLCIDKVVNTTDTLTTNMYRHSFLPAVFRAIAFTGQHVATEDYPDVLTQHLGKILFTLTAGRISTQFTENVRDGMVEPGHLLPAISAVLEACYNSDREGIMRSLDSTPMGRDLVSSVLQACLWRRFFTTASGKIGIGPRSLCVGDYIVRFAGGRLPGVLRGVDELRDSKGLYASSAPLRDWIFTAQSSVLCPGHGGFAGPTPVAISRFMGNCYLYESRMSEAVREGWRKGLTCTWFDVR